MPIGGKKQKDYQTGWSSMRSLERARVKQEYDVLSTRIQRLAGMHSVELGHAPKDFGLHNYALVPETKTALRGKLIGKLTANTSGTSGDCVVRVPLTASRLRELHCALIA